MITIDQIPWLTWGAIVGLGLALGVLLGEIIHERRMIRLTAFLTAFLFFMLALFCFTVGTWR